LASSIPTYLTYSPADDGWLTSNNNGNQTGYWRYDAYGTPTTAGATLTTPASPFGYSGQYTDTTTGLLNDRARWYEPQDAGLTTRDPLFATTDTAYGYASDDPVSQDDPSGLASRWRTYQTLGTDVSHHFGGNTYSTIRLQRASRGRTRLQWEVRTSGFFREDVVHMAAAIREPSGHLDVDTDWTWFTGQGVVHPSAQNPIPGGIYELFGFVEYFVPFGVDAEYWLGFVIMPIGRRPI
jgi:RHS repeat-associated protein